MLQLTQPAAAQGKEQFIAEKSLQPISSLQDSSLILPDVRSGTELQSI